MSHDDQLPHLATFSKAAEACSFTVAADALGLSQAAVSQRIQSLEQTLGKPLFQRKGGRVLLTHAGHQLYEFAQRILDLHRQARCEITGHEPQFAGNLFLAASSIPGEHLLPALLGEFGQKHPGIRIHAAVHDSMNVMHLIDRGEAGIGFVGRRTDNPYLEFRHFADDHLVLVVPPTHEICRRNSVNMNCLKNEALILREAGSGTRYCFETALQQCGQSLANFKVALELGSNEAIKEAVLQGIGVAVLSSLAVQKELQSGRLKVVELHDLRCDREMFVVLSKRRVLATPARVFVNFLETHPPFSHAR